MPRGRPKKKSVEKIVEEKIIESFNCTCCGETKKSAEFYKSNSIIYKAKKICQVCKKCIFELCKELCDESEDVQVGIFRLCRHLGMPYLESVYNSAREEVEAEMESEVLAEIKKNGIDNIEEQPLDGIRVFRKYIKNINSLPQYQGLNFENGESLDIDDIERRKLKAIEDNMTDRDKQNRDDVLRILGYDPFETESPKDRKYLFNRLVDMLDDTTLEDNVRLMSVIEIIKGFNQIDKINEVISTITQDIGKIASNNGGLKTLIDTKKNLMGTVLKIAEDNGISTKFNTNKAKGSGTLSGMIKKLSEIDLDEAKVNLFDIQTAHGMEQVAEISHQSIMKQLLFAENEYADMVAWQKQELYKLGRDKDRLEEEVRLIKSENQKLKNNLRNE